jgi:hypothetical protein
MRGPARLLQVPAEILFHGERSFESPLPNPAGIALFALAPLALLGIRTRPKLRAGIACAIFTAVYVLYWGAILQMVRYAILPFALIAIFLAARAWSFYDRQGRVVRISVAALATYCLLIAMMGLAIIGVNAPQFSYFAGKLDKLGYLRASMQAYGAVDYLRQRGDTQARVYGIENQARAYSANPSNFDAMWCSVRNGCDAARVLAAVRAFRADYLILPVERRVPESVLENLGNPPCVYNDSYFRIFALNGFDFTK